MRSPSTGRLGPGSPTGALRTISHLLAVKDGPTVGVDAGVGTMAVCSDGTTVENPKALASGLKRLHLLD